MKIDSRLLSTNVCTLYGFPSIENRTVPVAALTNKRGMATKKAKNKKKGSTGSKSSSSKLDTSLGDGIFDLKKLKSEMDLCTQKFKEELTKKFSSELTVGTIDNIHVTLNGKTSQLFEIAEVTSQDNKFHIMPMIKGRNVEKQIIDSIDHTGLNLYPKLQGKIITISKPVSSTDYKTNLLKLSNASGERSKTSIRKIRQLALSKIKKLKDFSKDDIKLIENQVDLMMEMSIQLIDKSIDNKKSELKL